MQINFVEMDRKDPKKKQGEQTKEYTHKFVVERMPSVSATNQKAHHQHLPPLLLHRK